MKAGSQRNSGTSDSPYPQWRIGCLNSVGFSPTSSSKPEMQLFAPDLLMARASPALREVSVYPHNEFSRSLMEKPLIPEERRQGYVSLRNLYPMPQLFRQRTALECLSLLQSDITAANNHQVFKQRFQIKDRGVVQVRDSLQPGDESICWSGCGIDV